MLSSNDCGPYHSRIFEAIEPLISAHPIIMNCYRSLTRVSLESQPIAKIYMRRLSELGAALHVLQVCLLKAVRFPNLTRRVAGNH